jgi:hypothetical protein
MIKRFVLCVGIILGVALLSGCAEMFDYSQVVEEMAQSEEQAEATPMPPLTEPMYEDEAALYNYYNEVGFDDTLSGLTERYGEPETNVTDGNKSYTWLMDDGYGVTAAFYENSRMHWKSLHLKDQRQLGKISKLNNLSGVYTLTTDYSFGMCRAVLGGKPMQIGYIAEDSSDAPDYSALYVWADEDGNLVQILFGNDGNLKQAATSRTE